MLKHATSRKGRQPKMNDKAKQINPPNFPMTQNLT
jgi:hypothetical protein